jgi:hypothetical protein
MRKRSRSKRILRKHAVYVNLNVPELTKAGSGLELYIYSRGEKLGEVDIGRGGFYWKGGYRHSRKRISWTDFAAKMDELAYGRD